MTGRDAPAADEPARPGMTVLVLSFKERGSTRAGGALDGQDTLGQFHGIISSGIALSSKV